MLEGTRYIFMIQKTKQKSLIHLTWKTTFINLHSHGNSKFLIKIYYQKCLWCSIKNFHVSHVKNIEKGEALEHSDVRVTRKHWPPVIDPTTDRVHGLPYGPVHGLSLLTPTTDSPKRTTVTKYGN